jgi:membrane protein
MPIWSRLAHLYQKEIWQTSVLKDRSWRGFGFATLRVISITITVFNESRVASRAAALSFSSLLGLGPLIAIAVLIGGFSMGGNANPDLLANKLGELIEHVAPQLRQLDTIDAAGRHNSTVSPEIVSFVTTIIVAARSGAGGVFGIFSLIFVVLLLFKSIEDAFNDIWGVGRGRSVVTRIVFYWTILTLGAVLFFAAIALLGASTFLSVFNTSVTQLPGGEELLKILRWSLPVFSFTLLVALLTLVYRVIPNTRVFWGAALVGGVAVTVLLQLNNFVALLYVKRVIQTKSLYGSVALPLVLMLGLYVFWLYLLIGALVSYAIQNVHFRNSQAAWSTLSESMRERVSLAVFLTICRRFRECLPPISASHLSEMLKVPTQLLNACLNRLEQLKLITPLRPNAGDAASDYLYQPARPLNRITLHDFKTLDENFGENPFGSSLERIDPLIAHYDATLAKIGQQEFFHKSVEELFAEHPFEESRPPFRLGERPAST